MKKTSRGSKPIRQNRPNFRKEIISHKKINVYQKPQKIKGKNYVAVN